MVLFAPQFPAGLDIIYSRYRQRAGQKTGCQTIAKRNYESSQCRLKT